nr:hypothetical protein [Tanacetum cinerariifolium]
MNKVGSIEPLENPLDSRNFESSSYRTLGACLSPYNAFLSRISHGFLDVFRFSLTHGASAEHTAEDLDTTLEDPLSNSSNIGLNSKSSSFDVVTVLSA